MKKRTIAGVVIALVLVAVGIVSSIPRKVTGSYMLCSSTGEVKEAVFDIAINRGLLSGKGNNGKIVFNGVEYISEEDAYVRGPSGRDRFVVPTTSPIDITKSLYLVELGDDEEYIWLQEINENGQNSYYGPAQSIEELTAIYEKILY